MVGPEPTTGNVREGTRACPGDTGSVGSTQGLGGLGEKLLEALKWIKHFCPCEKAGLCNSPHSGFQQLRSLELRDPPGIQTIFPGTRTEPSEVISSGSMEDLLLAHTHPQSGFWPAGWGMGCGSPSHPSSCWEVFDPKICIDAPSQCGQLVLPCPSGRKRSG